MQMNDAGVMLIKEFEGCKLKAYPDPATGGDPWTIGYGATGEGIKAGVVWTQAQADERLAVDIKSVSDRISRLITTQCNDNQFSAMVCLAYNIGVGNFKSSTLLKLVNQGKFEDASHEFIKWCRAGGKIMPGLITRREAEKALFIHP